MASLRDRVVSAAEDVIADARSVAPLDVFGAMGWLTLNHVDYWRQGRDPHLAPLVAMRRQNLDLALDTLRRWAQESGLVPAEIEYVSATRDRRPLQFVGGD